MAPQCQSPVSKFSKHWHEKVPLDCSDTNSLRPFEHREAHSQLSNPPLAVKVWGSKGCLAGWGDLQGLLAPQVSASQAFSWAVPPPICV